MDILDRSRQDWTQQVRATADASAQVGRQGDRATLDALVKDIRSKLRMSADVLSIADIGCGNGLVLRELIDRKTRFAGIDYSEDMIREAQKALPGGDFHVQGANKLPFADKSFDRVLCYSIFHYFPSDAYAHQTLAELVRITAPGGTILVGDVLDRSHEDRIKGSSDPEIEKTLPYIHRYSSWRFYELGALALSAELLGGVRAEILEQPAHFRLHGYRKDLRLDVT